MLNNQIIKTRTNKIPLHYIKKTTVKHTFFNNKLLFVHQQKAKALPTKSGP